MNEPNPFESMAYLRRSWNESMREVPEARRPRSTHHGWLLGLLPESGQSVPITASESPDEHHLAATGSYALASLPRTAQWGLYQWYGPVVQLVAPLITSPTVFSDSQPTPPVDAQVLGTDGIGVLLETDNGPIRWLLLDGYAYYLSDTHTPGRWAVHEAAADSHTTN